MVEETATMEEKCENLMNVVVESRKQLGKMWVEYSKKCSLVEEKMLSFQLKTIANYKNKLNKNFSTDLEDDEKEAAEFANKLLSRQKRIEELAQKIKDTQAVVLQIKSDSVGKKLHQPLTAEALRNEAEKRKQQNSDNIVTVK